MNVVQTRNAYDAAFIAGQPSKAELRNHGIDLTEIRGDIDRAKGITDPYIRKLTTLAFLAPDIQSAILEGRQPQGMTLATMIANPIPLDWHEQRQTLGFEISGA